MAHEISTSQKNPGTFPVEQELDVTSVGFIPDERINSVHLVATDVSSHEHWNEVPNLKNFCNTVNHDTVSLERQSPIVSSDITQCDDSYFEDLQIVKNQVIDIDDSMNMSTHPMQLLNVETDTITCYRTIVPEDMVERRANIVARLKSPEDGVAPFIAFLRNAGTVQELKSDNHYNLQWLNDKYQIDPTTNPKLCNYRLQICGDELGSIFGGHDVKDLKYHGSFEGSKEASTRPGLQSISSPRVLCWSTPPGSERVTSKSTCTSSQDFAIAQHADSQSVQSGSMELLE
ncbi:hypothetical protein KIW84_014123 [Lathyrus oleraceus]|uniref:Eukaryotic translation initiation factor 3 subunit E N-terminal domain-containing protein n=1 Tax=Pisum sativum TaxID=3888 RepID=A0A9D5GZ37_PEA|nr:hypothetical protein KIW84_014123 [Pisum sativum]